MLTNIKRCSETRAAPLINYLSPVALVNGLQFKREQSCLTADGTVLDGDLTHPPEILGALNWPERFSSSSKESLHCKAASGEMLQKRGGEKRKKKEKNQRCGQLFPNDAAKTKKKKRNKKGFGFFVRCLFLQVCNESHRVLGTEVKNE